MATLLPIIGSKCKSQDCAVLANFSIEGLYTHANTCTHTHMHTYTHTHTHTHTHTRTHTHTHAHTHAHTHTHTHSFQVKRDSLLQDAYRFIMGTPAKKLRRQKCNIKWDMEEGSDNTIYGSPG